MRSAADTDIWPIAVIYLATVIATFITIIITSLASVGCSSNLEFLRIASLDYHLARMLGLGHLDLSSETRTGKYFYLAE